MRAKKAGCSDRRAYLNQPLTFLRNGVSCANVRHWIVVQCVAKPNKGKCGFSESRSREGKAEELIYKNLNVSSDKRLENEGYEVGEISQT